LRLNFGNVQLGYGDLSCYGQQKFRTPNIDRLAAEGMKFTAHYSGNNVCAPARCVLMSGKHPGHAYIRDNRGGMGPEGEGQEPVPARELALPLTLKKLCYTFCGFGRWGLGAVGGSGDPNKQGFDVFFGYNCQVVAHNYYPTHLRSNTTHAAIGNPKFFLRTRNCHRMPTRTPRPPTRVLAPRITRPT
jgi:arylsulfatase A